MLFYFTGTGNSLYVAKKIHNLNEVLVNMADALNKGEYIHKLEDNQRVGFVLPVYIDVQLML